MNELLATVALIGTAMILAFAVGLVGHLLWALLLAGWSVIP